MSVRNAVVAVDWSVWPFGAGILTHAMKVEFWLVFANTAAITDLHADVTTQSMMNRV